MKHHDAVVDRLKNVTLFSACTPQELTLIYMNTTQFDAKSGDVLAGEGRTGYEFVVIVEGKARVMVGDRQVAMLGPGDFFGEVALLDNGPRTASVIADTDLVARVASQREFEEMITRAPHVARSLLVGLARRLRAADHQLVS